MEIAHNMAIEQETKKALEALNKSINDMAKSISGVKSPKSYSSLTKLQKQELEQYKKKLARGLKLEKAEQNYYDLLVQLDKNIKKTSYEYSDSTSALASLNKAYKRQTKELKEIERLSSKGRSDQERYLERYSDALKGTTSELSKQLKKSSLLGAALLKSSSRIDESSIEYHKLMENLSNTTKQFDEGMLKYAGIWDEGSKSISKSLSADDIADAQLKISSAAAEVVDSFSSLKGNQFKNFNNLLGKNAGQLVGLFKDFGDTESATQEFKDRLLDQVMMLEDAGLINSGITKIAKDINGNKVRTVDQEALMKINAAGGSYDGKQSAIAEEGAELIAELLSKLGGFTNTAIKAQQEFTREATLAASALGELRLQAQENVDAHGEILGTLKTIPAAFSVFKEGLSKAGDALHQVSNVVGILSSYNIASVPMTFKDAQIQSVKMGMSFEETTKYLQENRGLMAALGSNYTNRQGQITDIANANGLTMSQAAGLIKPATDIAMASGVNITTNELNESINNTLQGFTKLGGILDITREQYLESIKAVKDNTDNQMMMIGLTKEQAASVSSSIELNLQDNAAKLGSITAATELMHLQQRAAHTKVIDRISQNAFFEMQSRRAGASEEDILASRAVRMMPGTAQANSKEANDAQTRLYQLNAAYKAQSRQNAANEGSGAFSVVDNMFQLMADRTGSWGEAIDSAGTQMQKMENSGAITDLNDPRAKEANTLAKANDSMAKVAQKFDQVNSAFGNEFLKSIFRSVAALSSLTLSAFSAAMSLRSAGGLGALSGAGGKLGKLGKVGLGVGGLVGGLVLSAGGDYAEKTGHNNVAGGLGVAGDALTGASLGFMLGGPLGALIGGGLGAGVGLYRNWDKFGGPEASEVTGPTISPMPISPTTSSGMSIPVVGTAATAAMMGGTTDSSNSNQITPINKATEVNDITGNMFLSEISANTKKTVELLQSMMEGSSSNIIQTKRNVRVPLAADYFQGNTAS